MNNNSACMTCVERSIGKGKVKICAGVGSEYHQKHSNHLFSKNFIFSVWPGVFFFLEVAISLLTRGKAMKI